MRPQVQFLDADSVDQIIAEGFALPSNPAQGF